MIGSRDFYTRKSSIFAFSHTFTLFSHFYYFSHDTNTFRTFPNHVTFFARTLSRFPSFSDHFYNFFWFFVIFVIIPDFLRLSPILCEFSRVSHTASISELPRTHYRRLSASFISFYVRLLRISSRTPLYVTFHTSAPFLFSYSSLIVQHEAFLLFSRTTLFSSRKICGYSRILF